MCNDSYIVNQNEGVKQVWYWFYIEKRRLLIPIHRFNVVKSWCGMLQGVFPTQGNEQIAVGLNQQPKRLSLCLEWYAWVIGMYLFASLYLIRADRVR